MRFLVVGAGSWGTAFSRVLLERGHEGVLACRSREQAEAIAATGWNPPHPRRGVRAVRGRDAGGDAGGEPREGPRPRDGRAPVDARSRALGRRPLWAEHGG